MEESRQDLEALLDKALQNDELSDEDLRTISHQVMTKCNDIRRDAGVPIGQTSLGGALVCDPVNQKQCMAVASEEAYAKCVQQATCRLGSVEDSMFNTCFVSADAARSFRDRVVSAYHKRSNKLIPGNYVILPCLLARSAQNESLRLMMTPRGRFQRTGRGAGNTLFLLFEEGPIVPMVLEDMLEYVPYGRMWSLKGLHDTRSLEYNLT